MSASAEEITDEFLDFDIKIDNDVLSKLEEIASLFSFSAENLLNEWIAYQSRNDHPALDYTQLELLEQELSSSRAKSAVKKSIASSNELYSSTKTTSTSRAVENILEGYCSPANKNKLETLATVTPVRALNKGSKTNEFLSPSVFSPVSASSTLSQKYANRSNAGEVVATLSGSEFSKFKLKHAFEKNCKVHEQMQSVNTRYMFQKTIDICDVLNDAVEDFAEELMEQNESIESYAPCSAPSQGEVVVVGRIKSENAVRLSAVGVILEGDRVHSYGRSVNVDLTQLEEYSFFPGQITAIGGSNPSGKTLVATHLYSSSVENGKVQAGTLEDFKESDKDLTSMVVAAGPFTTSETLSYEPLADLFEVIRKSRPDVTVLIGPLLDSNHEEVKNGALCESFSDLSNKYFRTIRNELEDYTQVVLIPSVADVFHHPVFPQPPYSQRPIENIHLLSNPSVFLANHVKIGVTSADVLFHLGAEEISKSASSGSDRLARLIQHLLYQKSFYPLYPSHESIPLDVTASELRCALPQDLELLLLPSDLRCFIKMVKGRLCVNPGRLAKGLGGGTYARVLFNADKKAMAEIVRI